MKTGSVLAVLTFAILTLWIGQRWALSCLEVSAYLAAGAIVVRGRGRLRVGIAVLAPALMCALAAIQWAGHWSAVPSATIVSGLYWMAAACFALIGGRVPGDKFLRASVAVGALICVVGTLQLFTSPGKIFWLFPSGFDRRVIGPFVSPNNYAAFVELLLPVALTRRRWPYLVAGAVLAATVVASGSRTGAVLVLAEIAIVMVLQKWSRWPVLAFALLAASLTLIVGTQLLASRFAQTGDIFAVRREFLHSSLAMFRAEPLHGFGLGTWPFVYPRFAIIDTGEIANHAHNEWAQWAAEGGVPALAVMVGLLVLTVRPAVQSVWGIGALAVFAHALVDYPFLRLGLAAWFFAFLGVLSAGRSRRFNLPIAAVIPVLLLGAWLAGKLAYADVLYRHATLSSVRRAAALMPDRAEYQVLLAQLDFTRAPAYFQSALADNSYDTHARIGLAFERETAGDPGAAAKLLLEAASYDRQFAPAWALSGFYLRHGDVNEFWRWADRAAVMSYGDRRAFFDLCFLASDDPGVVFTKTVAAHPDMESPFLDYLVARHRVRDAAEVAERMAAGRPPVGPDALLDYIDAALDAGEAAAAWRVQSQLLSTRALVMNGDFASPLLNRGFDWRIVPDQEVTVARTQEGGSILSIEFSGREADSFRILTHALALAAQVPYILQFDYRTIDLPSHSGVSWRLGAGREIVMDASTDWRHENRQIPGTTSGLTLAYRRDPGNTRAEGRLLLRNVKIDAARL